MKMIFVFLIRVYQKLISPLKMPCCRFTPTCSEYAVEALKLHGVIKGFILIFSRIIRCNPFCKGGYDPVPKEYKLFKRNKKTEESNQWDF